MVIECNNLNDFLDIVEGLLKRGLMFNSNASTLIITLTGGY